MTLDDRRNEVLKSHAAFLNALAIGAVVGGALAAGDNRNWLGVLMFAGSGLVLHLIAAEVLGRLRIVQ